MTRTITAIDPGTHESAILSFNGTDISEAQILPNDQLLDLLRHHRLREYAVEMIASYGMAVGREVFETCLVIGQIKEIARANESHCNLVYRLPIKIWLCGTPRAKDANISQALKDKYGQVGTAKNKGPLYGIKSHLWSALAVADYALHNTSVQ